MRKSIEERFWEKVDVKSPEECWNWKGSKRNGYGMFWLNGSASTAHRVAYFIKNGKIPDNMDILHRCNNPACCNPAHIYCGTHTDNMQDLVRKGTNQKLWRKDILAIRDLNILTSTQPKKHKYSETTIAKKFNVSRGTIHNIWNSDSYICKEGFYV